MKLFAVLAFTLSTIALLLIWCFNHTGWADVIAFFAAIGGFALGFYVNYLR